MEEAKVRISLATGDLEIAGSEAFVAKYDKAIQQMLDKLGDGRVGTVALAPTTQGQGTEAPLSAASDVDGRSFGEVLHSMPKGASGTDQILVAGHFAAQRSADKTFGTNDANRLLLEQGIKLSNPSQSMRNNLGAKRVFKVGSNFRLSRTGEEYVATLLGSR